MPRSVWIVVAAACVLALLAAMVGSYARCAAVRPQPFYRAALAAAADRLELSSRRLESRMSALCSDAYQQSLWRAAFSEDEINGWLAVGLEEKFPGLLPERLSQPRLALKDGKLMLGFLHRYGRRQLPVSLELEAFAADSDLVAIRFCGAWVGDLPIPVNIYVQHLSDVAGKLDWALRWIRHDGDPVAMAPLRGLISDASTRRELETVELRDGELILSGKTLSPTVVHSAAPVKSTTRR